MTVAFSDDNPALPRTSAIAVCVRFFATHFWTDALSFRGRIETVAAAEAGDRLVVVLGLGRRGRQEVHGARERHDERHHGDDTGNGESESHDNNLHTGAR